MDMYGAHCVYVCVCICVSMSVTVCVCVCVYVPTNKYGLRKKVLEIHRKFKLQATCKKVILETTQWVFYSVAHFNSDNKSFHNN